MKKLSRGQLSKNSIDILHNKISDFIKTSTPMAQENALSLKKGIYNIRKIHLDIVNPESNGRKTYSQAVKTQLPPLKGDKQKPQQKPQAEWRQRLRWAKQNPETKQAQQVFKEQVSRQRKHQQLLEQQALAKRVKEAAKGKEEIKTFGERMSRESAVANPQVFQNIKRALAALVVYNKKGLQTTHAFSTTKGLLLNKHADAHSVLCLDSQKKIIIPAEAQVRDVVGTEFDLVSTMIPGIHPLKKKDFALPQQGELVELVVKDAKTIKTSVGSIVKLNSNVLGFKAAETDAHTDAGDCGSAYVNTAGKIVGFHFAGMQNNKTNAFMPVTEEFLKLFDTSLN